ncbi:hypothetical protein M3P05_01290 [Sansalvadorimonas sp. 2012CJ34-2]|uniref:Uncharacterized protein n=1 Tax=Parendozoicomonas callyspongiae TaxID=2942213 RepID=A0ABT0PB24_9GAMM|nr:hypothetical protein [Sansalvadorimonas sp. 2012CJ34-2]MCL6268587.1 hypothetical protein [Sansalvadorimonas sp. 2012CJ34-2]
MPKANNLLTIIATVVSLSFPLYCVAQQDSLISSDSSNSYQQASLSLHQSIHGLPVLKSYGTTPKTLMLAEESLNQLLDQGTANSAEGNLVSFMINNGYRVVVTDRDYDLDNLDENEFPEEKTALISSQGIRADSYLTEPLRLVAQARIDQLRAGAEKGDEQFKNELQSLYRAISALKKNGFYLETDDEDDIDLPGYIVLSEMVLAEQFQGYLDRFSGALKALMNKLAESEGKAFDSSELDKELRSLKPWYEASPDSFRMQVPDICEWLKRNNLASTTKPVPTNPINMEDEFASGFLTDPFDEDEDEDEDE